MAATVGMLPKRGVTLLISVLVVAHPISAPAPDTLFVAPNHGGNDANAGTAEAPLSLLRQSVSKSVSCSRVSIQLRVACSKRWRAGAGSRCVQPGIGCARERLREEKGGQQPYIFGAAFTTSLRAHCG